MSATITDFYMQEQDTKSTARLVLWALAECANQEGYCFPGIKTIANRCNKSERVIQRALQSLEADGKIGRKIHDGKNTKYGKTNGYYLNDYRVSVGIDPVVTFVTPKTSPVGVSSKSKVSFQAVGGVGIVTQTNTQNQNILTTTLTTAAEDKTAQLQRLVIALERELKIKDQELTLKNEEIHELKIKIEQSLVSEEQKESSISVLCPTDESARDIELKPCGEKKKEFIKVETLNDITFPIQMSKFEKTEITNLLVKKKIPNEEWQDMIDTLAWKMKKESVPSKAGYLNGIIKSFQNGTFTKENARKIQAKRQPKIDSAITFKNKVEQIAEKNRKPIIDDKTTKMIEIINQIETKAELQQIYPNLREFNGDYVMNAWSKRFYEVRA